MNHIITCATWFSVSVWCGPDLSCSDNNLASLPLQWLAPPLPWSRPVFYYFLSSSVIHLSAGSICISTHFGNLLTQHYRLLCFIIRCAAGGNIWGGLTMTNTGNELVLFYFQESCRIRVVISQTAWQNVNCTGELVHQTDLIPICVQTWEI